jgi:hypothetical protein
MGYKNKPIQRKGDDEGSLREHVSKSYYNKCYTEKGERTIQLT